MTTLAIDDPEHGLSAVELHDLLTAIRDGDVHLTASFLLSLPEEQRHRLMEADAEAAAKEYDRTDEEES